MELIELGQVLRVGDGVRRVRIGHDLDLVAERLANGTHVVEILTGLEIGYRLIDTAEAYGNESEIGDVLRRAGLPRDELFVTSKVWNSDQGYESTLRAFRESCARLRLDCVDLYLIHWPEPSLTRETWRALEELRARGDVRAIGVSNFMQRDLDMLFECCELPPAVDQFEFHPHLQRHALVDYCRSHGVTVEAWAPLMRGRGTDLPQLAEIGERHGKTAAQVTLRWILQQGIVTIPKSVHAERIRENADVFDFALSDDEMAAIDALDRGQHES
jgi:diketogulonate reductase-like aldo/keto reductase